MVTRMALSRGHTIPPPRPSSPRLNQDPCIILFKNSKKWRKKISQFERKWITRSVPLFKSHQMVKRVCSGLRPILHLCFVEIHSAVFVQSCWQTNQPTDKRPRIKTQPPWWGLINIKNTFFQHPDLLIYCMNQHTIPNESTASCSW